MTTPSASSATSRRSSATWRWAPPPTTSMTSSRGPAGCGSGPPGRSPKGGSPWLTSRRRQAYRAARPVPGDRRGAGHPRPRRRCGPRLRRVAPDPAPGAVRTGGQRPDPVRRRAATSTSATRSTGADAAHRRGSRRNRRAAVLAGWHAARVPADRQLPGVTRSTSMSSAPTVRGSNGSRPAACRIGGSSPGRPTGRHRLILPRRVLG